MPKRIRIHLNQAKFLWFLTISYSMVYVISNWFDPRQIRILNLNTGGGIFIFPFTFLLSDLITEVYGYKHARIAIWAGFLFNMLFILYGLFVTHMPSSGYSYSTTFDSLLTINVRIIIASAISYLLAEPLNSFIIAKLKIKMDGHFMGLRFVLSTLMASGTDTFLFCMIGFYGIIGRGHLIFFILSSWLIKVAIEILGLPVSVRLAKKLKQLEIRDTYDRRTKFNVFSLETKYYDSDNEYAD